MTAWIIILYKCLINEKNGYGCEMSTLLRYKMPAMLF